MSEFIETLFWGLLIGLLSFTRIYGWIVIGIAGLFPLLRRYSMTEHLFALNQARTKTLELALGCTTPLLLTWFGLSISFLSRPDRALAILAAYLLGWIVQLLLLYRHPGVGAWLCVVATCLWMTGIYVGGACFFDLQPYSCW